MVNRNEHCGLFTCSVTRQGKCTRNSQKESLLLDNIFVPADFVCFEGSAFHEIFQCCLLFPSYKVVNWFLVIFLFVNCIV